MCLASCSLASRRLLPGVGPSTPGGRPWESMGCPFGWANTNPCPPTAKPAVSRFCAWISSLCRRHPVSHGSSTRLLSDLKFDADHRGSAQDVPSRPRQDHRGNSLGLEHLCGGREKAPFRFTEISHSIVETFERDATHPTTLLEAGNLSATVSISALPHVKATTLPSGRADCKPSPTPGRLAAIRAAGGER